MNGGNPNYIVPTAPPGTSDNQAASTAFVQNAIGGGGGGIGFVGTLPALIALPIPTGSSTVLVSDRLRGGVFVWSVANHSVDVTSDPGQGITVAPAADTSGASGAWVRNYDGPVDWAWWGAVPDGVVTFPNGPGGDPNIISGTDNGVAFVKWNIWGQTQKGIHLVPTAGTYLYNGSTSFAGQPACYSLVGIRDMYLDGRRVVTLQNTYRENVSGANSAFSTNFFLMAKQVITGFLINQTTVGATTFVLQNAADAANLFVGQTVCLASLDKQYLGFPPNPYFFEWVTIAAISGTTTITITILEKIKFQHRADFPDYNLTPPYNCGAARVWITAPSDAWDGKFIIKRMTVNKTPGLTTSQPYATFNKREIVTEDWSGVGFSETIGRTFVHDNAVWFTPGEIDKFIDTIIYNNCRGYQTGLGSQSATPNRMIINGGSIANVTGFAKQLLVRGTRIGIAQPGAQFGLASSARFEECDIDTSPPTSLGNITDGAVLNVIDGTKVRWALPGTIVGSITGSVLTLTSVASGSAIDIVGLNISGTGVPVYTTVASLASGVVGQPGSTYILSTSTGTSAGATITLGNIGVIKVNLPSLLGNVNLWGVVPGTQVNMQAATSASGNIFSNDLGSGMVVAHSWDNSQYQQLNISSGTYVSATGVITLTVSGPVIFGPGAPITLTGLTGTGTLTALNTGIFPALAGTTGTTVVLQAPTGLGAITITGGAVYAGAIATITTNLPFSATPSWSTGSIYLLKNGNVSFIDCTGSDNVRNASDAFAIGQRYFEYRRFPFGGINGQSMTVNMPAGAQLLSVMVNVIDPSSVGTARLTLIISTITTPAMATDTGGTVITINLGLAGVRVINQTQWAGQLASDAITVGGAAATFLPPGRLVGPTMGVQFFTAAPSAGQSPFGEVVVSFSAGIIKKLLTRQYDDSGTQTPARALIPSQGALP